MKDILVVDDDVCIVRAYSRLFSAAGYEVMGATTVDEAKTILEDRQRSFGAVLLDLSLGSQDSGTLVPIIRKRHPGAGIALVSGTPDAPRWLEVGPQCDIVLPKPVPVDTLLRVVKKLESCHMDALEELAKECGLARGERRVLQRARTHSYESVQEIAVALGITKATAETHLQRIYNKTGIRSLRGVLALLDSRSRQRVVDG